MNYENHNYNRHMICVQQEICFSRKVTVTKGTCLYNHFLLSETIDDKH